MILISKMEKDAYYESDRRRMEENQWLDIEIIGQEVVAKVQMRYLEAPLCL